MKNIKILTSLQKIKKIKLSKSTILIVGIAIGCCINYPNNNNQNICPIIEKEEDTNQFDSVTEVISNAYDVDFLPKKEKTDKIDIVNWDDQYLEQKTNHSDFVQMVDDTIIPDHDVNHNYEIAIYRDLETDMNNYKFMDINGNEVFSFDNIMYFMSVTPEVTLAYYLESDNMYNGIILNHQTGKITEIESKYVFSTVNGYIINKLEKINLLYSDGSLALSQGYDDLVKIDISKNIVYFKNKDSFELINLNTNRARKINGAIGRMSEKYFSIQPNRLGENHFGLYYIENFESEAKNIIKPQNQKIEFPLSASNTDGFIVKKNDSYSIYSDTGEIISEKYRSMEVSRGKNDGENYYVGYRNNLNYIIDKSGKEIHHSQFQINRYLTDDLLTYMGYDENNLYGIIDVNENIIVCPMYNYISVSDAGYIISYDYSNDLIDIFDLEGTFIKGMKLSELDLEADGYEYLNNTDFSKEESISKDNKVLCRLCTGSL